MSEKKRADTIKKEMSFLSDIASGYQRSIVLLTAVKENLFTFLGNGSKTARQVAAGMKWDTRIASRLCNALIGLGVLEKRNGKYRNTKLAVDYLVEGSPTYQGNILEHHWHLIPRWMMLENTLRTGKPADAPHPKQRTKKQLEAFILGMQNIAVHSANDLLKKVDLSNSRKMLDVGGGPGTYSIAFTKAYPKLHATVLDLKDVIPIARKEIKREKATRVNTKIGDMLEGNFGGGYDVILVSNIIHMLTAKQIQKLFNDCAEATVSGGLLIVKDFYCNEDRTGPPFSTLFAINMILGNYGDTYTANEVKNWLRESGYKQIRKGNIAGNSAILVARNM